MQTDCASVKPSKRPWGWFRVLVRGKGWWLKRLTLTGGATSLQRHSKRGEIWVLYVPPHATHRIIGRGSLLELAVGTPSERDVERLHDLYGRTGGEDGPECRVEKKVEKKRVRTPHTNAGAKSSS